jgi:hypothetical protein
LLLTLQSSKSAPQLEGEVDEGEGYEKLNKLLVVAETLLGM